MPFAFPAPSLASTLAGHQRDGNRVDLKLDDGEASVEFWSDSTFRFTRHWGKPPAARDASPSAVAFELSETPVHLRLASKHLVIEIEKSGLRVRASEVDGTVLMADAGVVERKGRSLAWERTAARGARFYGLGARAGPLDFRGTRVEALKPFLISSVGYGEYHVAPGRYTFDARPADRYRIEAEGADMLDYYCFYGPAPKDIFEQVLPIAGPIDKMSPSKFRALAPGEVPGAATFPEQPGDSLEDFIRRLVNGSMSAILMPGFVPKASSPRAMQLGAVMPVLVGPERPGIRARLTAYWMTYAEEARDRGFPFLRPMPMQYPRDPEAGRYGDQFLLGDEILVAPIFGEGRRRTVYLPMGIWTNLATGEVFKGRQAIPVESDELPLFSRNGAILPLGQDPMELHYFPKLGGEFFLYEADLADYSQVHASPAGDVFRLEIESKKDREFEWIVHHLERPRKVTVKDQPLKAAGEPGALPSNAWRYVAAEKSLHVRVAAEKGDHHIATVWF
ncbi:MAG: DUF4968 domain-containing protein [Acidobacteria bacterium]|nr:DUF4968 domain-containing protein [Acidobacteriota bacterium]